jgi:hypothetical protein
MAAQRGDVGFVLGLCGFLMGAIGFYFGHRASNLTDNAAEVRRQDGETLEGLVNRVSRLEKSASGAPGHAPVTVQEMSKLADDLAAANKRMSAIEFELATRGDEINALRAKNQALEGRLHELERK